MFEQRPELYLILLTVTLAMVISCAEDPRPTRSNLDAADIRLAHLPTARGVERYRWNLDSALPADSMTIRDLQIGERYTKAIERDEGGGTWECYDCPAQSSGCTWIGYCTEIDEYESWCTFYPEVALLSPSVTNSSLQTSNGEATSSMTVRV